MHRDKRAVAASFSRAAITYDQVAGLQREVGERLLAMLPAGAGPVLDLGCGTGHFLPALAARGEAVLGLDLAEGMLRFVRTRRGDFRVIAGDAEQLPLADASIGLVYSNLALQWCEHLPLVFAELYRVLAPGGLAVISTLLEGTLDELRLAWAAVDQRVHVNRFFPPEMWRASIQDAGLHVSDWRQECRVMRYPRLGELVAELKGLGAHNVNRGRAPGLGGRAAFIGLCQAYERYRHDGALPATYKLAYSVVRREV